MTRIENTQKNFLKKASRAMTLFTLATLASIAFSKEISWRQVSHINESHPIVLPETGGYTVGTGKGSGLAFFNDDQVAVVTLAFNIDYLKGDGTFIAYETYAFPDGSAFTVKRNGRTLSINSGTAAEFEGSIQIINGKGRYSGITGEGTFNGKRLAQLASGADQYFDFKANYTTP